MRAGVTVMWVCLTLTLTEIAAPAVVADAASATATPPHCVPTSQNDNTKNKTPSNVKVNFAGKIKCLLWLRDFNRQDQKNERQQDEDRGRFSSKSVTPLPSVIPNYRTPPPSSSSKLSSSTAGEVGNGITPSKPLVPLFGRRQGSQESSIDRSSSSALFSARPSGVFTTIDYRFAQRQVLKLQEGQEEESSSSWGGLERIGTLLCWRRIPSARIRTRIFSNLIRFPSSIDVSLERTLPVRRESSLLFPIGPPLINVAGICLGWDRKVPLKQQRKDDNDDDDDVQFFGSSYRIPLVQIQVEGYNKAVPTEPFLKHKTGETGMRIPYLISTGFFLPLGRRFDLQLITHWNFWGGRQAGGPYYQDHDSNIINNNPDWWIPQITLDPLGSLSSENSFTAFVGFNDDRVYSSSRTKENINWLPNVYADELRQQSHNGNRYMIDFKLKLRTQVSLLALAAPHIPAGLGGDGDDDDGYGSLAASARFDCCLRDCQYHHSSTARLETYLIPSALWQSLKCTSSLSLLHERALQLGPSKSWI